MFSGLRKLSRRLSYWWNRDQHERELREEMEAHAQLRGRPAFGNTAAHAESARAVWIPSALEELAQDTRFGLRQLRRDPLFTAASITGLSIAIGFVTIMVSFVNAIFWRPLPVKHADRVVRITSVNGKGEPSFAFRKDEALHYRESGALEAAVSFARDDRVAADWSKGAENRAVTCQVDRDWFDIMGGDFTAGRAFSPTDDTPVAVITEHAWRKKMGADPSAIGRVLRLNRQPFTIIGIVADKSAAPLDASIDLFIPFGFERGIGIEATHRALLGRMREGSSLSETQAALDVAAAQWQAAHPDPDRRFRIQVSPARLTTGKIAGTALSIPGLLVCAMLLVLLIACINLANLMLARSESRRREIGARMALGAGKLRLVRQLLTECLIMTFSAGLAGLAISEIGTRLFLSWLNGALPAAAGYLWLDTSTDLRIFGATLGVCIVAAIFTGLAPIRDALRTDLNSVLRSGSGTAAAGQSGFGARLRSLLIVAQLTACTILLIATASIGLQSGMLEDSFAGIDSKPVIQIPLPLVAYGYNAERATALTERFRERIRAIPGIAAAGVSGSPMVVQFGAVREIEIQGRSGPWPRTAQVMQVSENLLATVAIGLASGRDFTARESATDSPVAIITERFARDYWPGESPLGRLIRLDPREPWREIIGVARDLSGRSGGAPNYGVFLPFGRSAHSYLLVRTSGERDRFLAPIRAEIAQLDPRLVLNPMPLQTMVDFVRLGPQLAALASRAVGLVALLMAAIGLYGVTAYTAARRSHEIGIRMTLGALRSDVLRMVFQQGAILVAAGLALGSLAGLATERAIVATYPIFQRLSGSAYLLVVVFQFTIASWAILIPSWRATRVDPVRALRCD